ncbi:hypothetical protein BK133_20155 [Paenibacillus sp. FSL H8-0548]|uniref:sensor histidine kinase n=1 Tax=Paenibacillus sp. FSL H8-0548 TaxID=1920422 RepID=UPI00096C724D|nr:histidine kinase [Paenibacillus sp. FSL H8-0548]OMF26754.1 hypothetical protein BK133_20155 [Paenibacillus sp. FSL H8-0548]
MKKLTLKRLRLNSLRIQITLSVLIMTLPLTGMLLYNNFYAIDVVRAQVADSYKNTLSLHMNQIDSNLNDIDSYIHTIAGTGYDLIALKQAETDDQYYMSKAYIFNKLSYDMALFKLLGSFFVYVEDRHDYMDVYSTGVSYEEKEIVKDHITNMITQQKIPKGVRTKRWQHTQIGQEHYLINIVKSGDVYLGGWVRTDELLKPLTALKLGEGGTTLIADDQGESITNRSLVDNDGINLRKNLNEHYLSGSDRKYLVVGTESYRGNFNLIAVIPDRNILANLPYLQRLIWFITISSLIFIPIGLYLMKQVFLNPLKRVLLAMSRVRGGDWGVRVNAELGAEEFKILGFSFNSMMNEIQTLRVNVFEEQLNKQREELQRLQLQVNPHFFLNALNIVYNLAKVKNHQLIMEMTMSLIKYFRFLFRSNTSFVRLNDELQHTRHYLSIQELRFPEKLTWKVDAPDYLTDIPVPPLVIQSFVENSIKHAVTMEEPIHITVYVGFEDEIDGSMMKISIKDTGKGFEDKVLQELLAGKNIENEQGEHIGIWNVQRRLKLLYNETVSIHYYNDKETGGAVVEIIVPTQPVMEGKR